MSSRLLDSIYDGFNLLCLQDDEYIFYDYDSSTLSPPSAPTHDDNDTTATLLSGRIKLCSQSIYIISSSNPDTITRLPFEDIQLIESLTMPDNVDVATDDNSDNNNSDNNNNNNNNNISSLSINTTEINKSTHHSVTINTSKSFSIYQYQPATPYTQSTNKQTFILSFPNESIHTMCIELWHLAQSEKNRSSISRQESLIQMIQQYEQSSIIDERSLINNHDDDNDTSNTTHNNNNNTSKMMEDDVLLKMRGYRITPLVHLSGWIILTKQYIYFQPYFATKSDIKDKTILSFPVKRIVRVSQRAFHVQPIALEIFFSTDKNDDDDTTLQQQHNNNNSTNTNNSTNNNNSNIAIDPQTPSVLLAFSSITDKETFHSLLRKQHHIVVSSSSSSSSTINNNNNNNTNTTTTTISIDPPSLRQLTKEWRDNKLSNFQYLMQINDAAGRSFNDLTQYPIFPWVLTDYTSDTIDILHDSTIYRDLSKPIAAMNPSRVRQAREMHAALKASQGSDPPWMFGSHYSNPGVVVFYIARSNPHLMLHLQNGKFDAADRLFTSIAGAWESVTRWTSDLKELIPEFYYYVEEDNSDNSDGNDSNSSNNKNNNSMQQPYSFLLNWSGADFGIKSDGQSVSDVELPPWSNNNPHLFIKKMREALESPYVSAHLHEWIDLIFGCASRGKAAVVADNLFNFMTYDEIAIQYLNKEQDAVIRRAYEGQVREYGRTPRQVFMKKHPRKKGLSNVRKKNGSIVNRLCGVCVCGDGGEMKRKVD